LRELIETIERLNEGGSNTEELKLKAQNHTSEQKLFKLWFYTFSFTLPVPDNMTFEEEVQQRYQGRAGQLYHDTKRSIPDTAYKWVARLRAEKIKPYVVEGDVVFEFGVGTGWNLAELKCKKRIGFDLSEHLAQVLRSHGIEFARDTTAIADATMDVVICHHVLEHTPNPPQVLNEIKRVLRPQGKILLFVPYERERRYRSYHPAEPNHHLYSWNVQTLGNLVEDTGFNVVTAGIQKFGYDRFVAVWADRLGLGEWGFRLIRTSLHLLRPAFEVHIVAQRQ
jgi:SAM-dependent methyltransferase